MNRVYTPLCMVLGDCKFPFDLDVMNRLGKVLMPLSGYMLNRHTTSLGHLMLHFHW